MRISTANAHDTTIEQLTQRQRELSEAQMQLSSGKRVNRSSDDPISAARAERALASVERSGASLRGVDASRSAMTQTEGALGHAVELLQTAREALVAGGDASYTDAQRKVIASQIRDLRSQLFAVANRGDGDGSYLFGGQGSSLPPFIDAPGGVQFKGTRGEIHADNADGLPVTTDGAATWLSAPTGNSVFETKSITSNGSAWIDSGNVIDPTALTGATYRVQISVAAGNTTYTVLKNGGATALTNVPFVSGQAITVDGMAFTLTGQPAAGDEFEVSPSTPTLSVFDVLDKAAAELATPGRSSGAMTQSTTQNLRNLDSILGRLIDARATVGLALGRIDSVSDRLDKTKLDAQTERSAVEDLDMVAAISDFQNKQTGYDAALKAYSSVQRMTLFDYIKT